MNRNDEMKALLFQMHVENHFVNRQLHVIFNFQSR